MEVKSKRITCDAKRTIVLSDIHGNGYLLEKLLKRCEYHDQEDHLIILGDMIDKGQNSLDTLHRIMKLCEQGRVDVIMGNCDAIPLQIINGYDLYGLWHYLNHAPWKKHMLLWEMAEQCGIDLSSDKDYECSFQQLLKAFPKEFAFLSDLPHVLESEEFLFVHAGVETENYPYAQDAYTIMKNDNFARKENCFEKMIICGHTPVINYYNHVPQANPIYCEAKNIYSIDGGCGVNADGQLNAVIIEDGMFRSLYVDDLKQGEVCYDYETDQEDKVCIHWTNRQVELRLEVGDNALCFHPASGYEILLPKDHLYEENGQLCAKNFSNHQLDVHQGDRVGVIKEWEDRIYVKKGGVYGWIPSDAVKMMD